MPAPSASRLTVVVVVACSLWLACDKTNSPNTTPVAPERPPSEWVARSARGTPDPDLRSVYWNPDDSHFYAGGAEEITMDSPDGTEWTLRGIDGSGTVVGIASVGAAVISVNSDGRILCETCGGGRLTQYNWSPAAVASNLGLAVAVGAEGHVVTHDGQTQTEHDTGITADFTDVTWDGVSYFVASASDGALRRSADGQVWTKFADTHAGRVRAVAMGGSSMVVLGEDGQILQSGDRGASWQVVDGTSDLNDVVWTGKAFVAVGDRGTVLVSGLFGGWKNISTGVDKNLRAAASGGVLLIVGDSGTILSSTDGVTWEQRQPGRWLDFGDVIWTGTTFLACADVLPGVMPAYLSEDGITWSPVASVEDPYGIEGFGEAAWSGARAIVSSTASGAWWNGEHEYARVYASDDLQHWRIVQESHNSYHAEDVIWMNDEFFVVCSDEVLRSSDGEAWISEPLSTYGDLASFISVTVRDQTAYGISQDGRVFESPDLKEWNEVASLNLPGVKMDINWTGSEFLVCGYYSTKHVWWSRDLSSWEAMDPGTNFELYGIAGSPQRWVAVGGNGTIRTRDR